MSTANKVYTIIGIGIGPFNLGLAALCHGIAGVDCLFIDQQPCFDWHPGILIPGSRLQVPFYADLVTLSDPCNPFSYLAFLKAKGRMFRFAIQENYFVTRTNYNEYCRWVVSRIKGLQFNTRCISIKKENEIYEITSTNGIYFAEHIVLGTGTVPFVPPCATIRKESIFHSADYLHHKESILHQGDITLVGSGQSAAEIFYDLLQSYKGQINWFTRSPRFYPMDYSKLTLELSTPDYIDHFYSLPEKTKVVTLAQQSHLYKGINQSLLSAIYDQLADNDSCSVRLQANCELKAISPDLNLSFFHREIGQDFSHATNVVILATGYRPVIPDFIRLLQPYIQFDPEGNFRANINYSIDTDNSLFIQHAEIPTHGFNAADLSLGPYRNAVILNTILGYEHFTIEKNITFQTFGLPK